MVDCKHELTPEQGAVSYAYFNDDTVQTITDARGAVTTFAYNNRYLVKDITYTCPAGVAATASVHFEYDSAGNRISMSDGLGSVSYAYDTLSRMTSETRTFTGLGSYMLTYGSYNLSGELTSMTNHWNAQVGYSYDKLGRVIGVSGAGYSGVSSYVNSISYRAFGIKQMNYGNGKALSLQYDNRMRVTDWTVANVLGWQYSYSDVGENTGRVMFAKNTASSTVGGGRDDTLDRSFDYDHLGRLIVSHTGYEARLHMNRQQAGDPTTYGPYSQVYGYDQWGNMNVRYGWGGWDAGYVNWTPSYTNNRLTTNPATGAPMQYDASGNLTNDGYQSYSYDATGQQAYASGTALSQNYDGDGLRVKKMDNGATTFYLRSTVLGGQVVAEINGSGGWTRGYVYLGGQMLAIQANGVNWVHQDPITKSQRVTNAAGAVVSTIDVDPWGGETEKSSNQAFQPHRFTAYERDGNGGDEAMMRRYTGKWHRFHQPDPYDGSYNLTDPQSFNRFAYVQNDPVNFTDPTGLISNCTDETGKPIPDCVVINHVDDRNFWRRFILNSQFDGFSGGGPAPHGGDPDPQNPLSPTESASIQDGINRAGELLARQRCIDFINSLLQRAAAVIDSRWWATPERYTQTNGVYSGVNVVNAHNTYADLFAAGGVTATGTSGRHGENVTYGQTDPSNLHVSWNSEFFGLSRDDRGLHTLHEYLHQFRGFNDEVLANAARFVAGQNSRDFSRETNPVGAASRNLNELIRERCAP